MEAQNEGGDGEEGKLSDDGGSWESDIKTSSFNAMDRFEGAILNLGKSTDGNGEEGGLRKRHGPSLIKG
jgi:hypothetical protein